MLVAMQAWRRSPSWGWPACQPPGSSSDPSVCHRAISPESWPAGPATCSILGQGCVGRSGHWVCTWAVGAWAGMLGSEFPQDTAIARTCNSRLRGTKCKAASLNGPCHILPATQPHGLAGWEKGRGLALAPGNSGVKGSPHPPTQNTNYSLMAKTSANLAFPVLSFLWSPPANRVTK